VISIVTGEIHEQEEDKEIISQAEKLFNPNKNS